MIKKFSELKKGDRVLLVYPDHTHTAICLESPRPFGSQSKVIGTFLLLATSVSVSRDRNFSIPVISQEVKP